ncbi:Holliday junction branch migration protein RuvA [Acetivibrio saccincola]|jgi:Holliday junction DNA helicase RuvA|uniref:Holliday junction branch migration complex subunit RuvA n=1 Tax=Acetivibrio saccincola TaxID=1677857 RepID=A0A2K9EG80_9FIRM|nr:Holliday junction branch migration protein RuvA [Acetivibrio saccincola]AUG58225.1 Holliday junction ATP-dependent DNA helicase RuvA [Acetivibrio saccincola]NLW26657.1 Holliday junction branch migration protein RuvA [Acetivibrio saccincola]PQQ68102.1 Holliday junction branch migration protein RuvA [Acetivibrio saccincola]HOA96664.1 Holliday junction branch migration protein RuvA [Acetivibrio saccincola]HQD27642.1 Holliday junction branch migration protein RuvA [Acetivibrio saccincola]
MYAYIRGKLEYKSNDSVVIEASGVGYAITVPLSTIENIGSVGEEVKVYTSLHVREDVMALYGFGTREELNMFELLKTVSGIGPKVAISVLSSISPSKFALAVITDDIKTLTQVQGIGKKTAQRIILELKDKIKKEQLTPLSVNQDEIHDTGEKSSKRSEAVNALMVLGYTASEAERAVLAVYSEEMDLELIIKNALKSLEKK